MTTASTRFTAGPLALIAAGLCWFGYWLNLIAPFGDVTLSVLCGAMLAPPIFALIAPSGVLNRFAILILAVVPTALLAMLVLRTPQDSDLYTTFAAWPFMLAAVAAALCIFLLAAGEGRSGPSAVLFPLGAALFTGGLSGAAFFALDVSLVTKTPIHLALAVLSTVILAGILMAILSLSLPARSARFLRALIGLLPLLGFAGTILGIMVALGALPDLFGAEGGNEAALNELLRGLGGAFETTLIGIVASVAASFVLALLVDALPSDPG